MNLTLAPPRLDIGTFIEGEFSARNLILSTENIHEIPVCRWRHQHTWGTMAITQRPDLPGFVIEIRINSSGLKGNYQDTLIITLGQDIAQAQVSFSVSAQVPDVAIPVAPPPPLPHRRERTIPWSVNKVLGIMAGLSLLVLFLVTTIQSSPPLPSSPTSSPTPTTHASGSRRKADTTITTTSTSTPTALPTSTDLPTSPATITPIPSKTLLPPTDIPTSTSPPTVSKVWCAGTPPSQVWVGAHARVTYTDGQLPNRLRIGPGLNYKQIAAIDQGAQMDVVDGPRCANGFTWWQVEINGKQGWMAEGKGNAYYIEPYGN